MRFILVLLGVALAAAGPGYTVDTRAGCPPEGYTALSPNFHLDRLPSGGQYAICQTAEQGLTPTADHTFTVSSGVFRLRDSQLVVDENIQIVFEYPARPDWSDVAVTYINAAWHGVTIRAAPTEEQLASRFHPHWPVPFGHCGDFDTVSFGGVDPQEAPILNFDSCGQPTTIKKITLFGDFTGEGVVFTDSKEIVVQDAFFASPFFIPEQRRAVGNPPTTAFTIITSQIGFVNPTVYNDHDGPAFLIQDGSAVTICNPFIYNSDQNAISLVQTGDSAGNTLAVAGVTNIRDYKDRVFIQGDGIVFLLLQCPAVMRDTYSLNEYSSYFT